MKGSTVPKAEVAKSVYANQRGAGQAKFSVPLQHPQHGIDAGFSLKELLPWAIPARPLSSRSPGVCWLGEYRSERRRQGGGGADGGSGASERNTGKSTTHDRGWFYGAVIADPDGNRVRLVGGDLLKAACRSLYRVV